MYDKIFVNLPVKNLAASREFFTKLGFSFNAQFSNDDGACLVISEHIYFMLLTPKCLARFTQKTPCDTSKTTEALLSLNCDSRAAVDEIVNKALAAGATTSHKPEDHGFMYEWDFEDLDGHNWGFFWMDPNHVKPA